MPHISPTPAPIQEESLAGRRIERTLVAALILVAILARVLFPDGIAVEHFDEGVYVSNLLVGVDYDYSYPSRHLYSPPLLPWLIEWSQVALGVNDFSAVIINLVAGVLTVWLVWWIGRCWFGSRSGIAAATLAALSGMHILYSRTALTDPLLCLFLLAAVHATWRSLCDGDKSWAVLAGLLTGLGWWTKYNGWLPIAIGIAGAIPWLIFSAGRPRIRPTILCLAIIAGTAFLTWLPALLSIPGGYASVSSNHSRYLVGLAGWPETLWRQLLNHRQLEGAFGCLGLAAAVFAGSLGSKKASSPTLIAVATGLAALAAFSASSVVLVVIGAFWLVRSLQVGRKSAPPSPAASHRQLALWLLAAWICGLSVTTPLYTAFPRLTLPWLVALWLAAGPGLNWLADGLAADGLAADGLAADGLAADGLAAEQAGESPIRPRTSPAAWGIIAVAIAVIGVGLAWRPGLLAPAWQTRGGLAGVAGRVRSDIREALVEQDLSPDADFLVDVYGEPSLYFQLRKLEIDLALPVSSLRFAQPDAPPPPLPTFLVTGPHNQHNPRFQEQFQTAAPRLTLERTYEYAPSDLVLLNKFAPTNLTDEAGERRRYAIHLYRVR